MKMLKTLYQTDWYTPVHIMDPALSLRITVCMRVLHTEDSIASDDIYSKLKLLCYFNNNIIKL